MKTFNNQRTKLSALRIYLRYILQQSKDLVKNYALLVRVAISEQEKSEWQLVFHAAIKVVAYIENCRHDDIDGLFARGAHGLCAISAAQDALVSALRNTDVIRSSPNAPHCMYHLNLSKEHTLRAKCVVNAIVAVNKQDMELGTLWERAARHVQQQIQRRYTGAGTPFLMSGSTALIHLTHAKQLDDTASAEKYAELVELSTHAARNYRLVAVHSVLGHKTDHFLGAAKSYEAACKYAQQAAQCTPNVQHLWRKAASTMRLAAELYETTLPDDTNYETILDTVKIAQNIAKGTEAVVAQRHEVDSIQRQTTEIHTKVAECQVECLLPVWRAIAAELAKALSHWKDYLDYVYVGASSATEVLLRFNTSCATVARVTAAADEIQVGVDRSKYYRAQADRCGQFDNKQVQALWRECWTDAADYTHEVVSMKAKVAVRGLFSTTSLYSQTVQEYSIKAHMCVFCANQLLPPAIQYYDRAHDTEKGGNCGEAEFWRAAGECQLQLVAQYTQDIHRWETSEVVKSGDFFPQLSPTVQKKQLEVETYVAAAGYVRRSEESAEVSSWPEFGDVCDLYKLAATLVLARFNCRPQWEPALQQAETMCIDMVGLLQMNQISHTEREEMRMKKMGCMCAGNMLATMSDSTFATNIWGTAMYVCTVMVQWSRAQLLCAVLLRLVLRCMSVPQKLTLPAIPKLVLCRHFLVS